MNFKEEQALFYLQTTDKIDRDNFLKCLKNLNVKPFIFKPPQKLSNNSVGLYKDLGRVIDNLIVKLNNNNVENRDTSSLMFKWGIKNETLSDKRINLTDDIIRELRILKQKINDKDGSVNIEEQLDALLDQAIDFNKQLTNEHSRVRCGWKIDGPGSLDKLLREEKVRMTDNMHYTL